MKKLFILCSLFITFHSKAQILKPNNDLFNQYANDVRGKTASQVVQESLANYEAFIKLDVNSNALNPLYFKDIEKPIKMSKDNAQIVLQEINNNPVVSMYLTSKYDTQNKGIGFCFGRAMFANIYLNLAGLNRGSIKKAFVVGPMLKGAWGWHVTTIVQSEIQGKEAWLAIDPVAGRVMEVKSWYQYLQTMSDDGKLKLYITEAGKFGAGASNYNEVSISDKFYNNYFVDMMTWFQNNDVSHRLRF